MTHTQRSDMQELRAIILAVLDEGKNGRAWYFDGVSDEDEDIANQEQLDFCDAIQEKLKCQE
jgi:hypothetical protein